MKKFLPKFLPGAPARVQLPKALPCLDLPHFLSPSQTTGFASTKSLPESLPPTQLHQPSWDQFLCWALLFHLNLLTFGSFWAPSPSNTLRGPCTNSKPLLPCCRDGQGDPESSWISAGCQGRLQEENVDFGVHHTQSRSHHPLCCLLHRQSCPLTF